MSNPFDSQDPRSQAWREWNEEMDYAVSKAETLTVVELALWGGLLTVTTLLASVAAGFAAIVSGPARGFLIAVVGCALVAAGLVFYNFEQRRAVYRTLVEVPPLDVFSDQVKLAQHRQRILGKQKEHGAKGRRAQRCERLALILMGLAILFLLAAALIGPSRPADLAASIHTLKDCR